MKVLSMIENTYKKIPIKKILVKEIVNERKYL